MNTRHANGKPGRTGGWALRCRLRSTGWGVFMTGAFVAAMGMRPEIAAAGPGTRLCKLVSTDAISKAVHSTVVRAEAESDGQGCMYSTKGTAAQSTANHAMAMGGAMGGAPLDPKSQQMVSGFFNTMLGSSPEAHAADSRHPGEVLVLGFTVQNSEARESKRLDTGQESIGRTGSDWQEAWKSGEMSELPLAGLAAMCKNSVGTS
jgi:hypothetical protein